MASLPPRIYNWKDLSLFPDETHKTGFGAVSQAMLNVISIYPGEVWFIPDLGCDLENLLMELMDPITERLILSELIRCIKYFDPRININYQSSSVESDPDNNRYVVSLAMEVLGINSVNSEDDTQPLMFSFYLNRLLGD
jgi:phage baseplate assembly protein W